MSIKEKIKNSPFWKGVISLSAGQIVGQVITLAAMPVISRLYSDEQYGEYGIVISTASILIGIVNLGLSSCIMVSDDDEEARKMFRVILLLQVILTAIVSLTIIAISPYTVLFHTSLPYSLSVMLMFLYVSTSALFSLMGIYINRLNMNRVLFFNPLIKAICDVFITIPFGLLKYGFYGLIVANIITFSLASIHMLRFNNPFNVKMRFCDIGYVLKKSRHFVFFQYPANLMGIIAAQLPSLMLSNTFGNAALGNFTMCNRVFNFPMNLIATPIQTVYFRTASEKHRNNENIAPLTFSLVSKICYIAFIPILVMVFFGEQIFSWVLGSTWAGAGKIASILILHYVFTFCNNCVTYCRVSIGKQNWNLYATVIQLVLILLSLYVGYAVMGTLLGVLLFFAIFNTLWLIINIEISFICLKQYYIRWPLFAVAYSSAIIACYFIAQSIQK